MERPSEEACASHSCDTQVDLDVHWKHVVQGLINGASGMTGVLQPKIYQRSD